MKVHTFPVLILGSLFFLGSLALAANWNPLSDTGQAICYNGQGDEIIPCPNEGENFYGQDAQFNIGPSSSFQSELVNGDNEVTDNNSGLIWQQETADINNSNDITADDRVIWNDAVVYCRDLDYASATTWRLPTKFELRSIVDYSRSNPSIDPAVFSCENDRYWTITESHENSSQAWPIYFDTGMDFPSSKDSTYYVRCVRD